MTHVRSRGVKKGHVGSYEVTLGHKRSKTFKNWTSSACFLFNTSLSLPSFRLIASIRAKII